MLPTDRAPLPRFRISPRTKFQVLVALMIVSCSAAHVIPLLPWGADLHNSLVYQKCAAHRSPYEIPAAACGDLWDRDFFYPPLFFHSFRWLRSLDLSTAMVAWTCFNVVALCACLFVWSSRLTKGAAQPDRHQLVLFCSLLFVQYPFVFLLERGGSDMGVVTLVSLAAYFFSRGWIASAGGLVGVAAAYKVYPAISGGVVGLSLLIRAAYDHRGPQRWYWARFGGGFVAAVTAAVALFPHDSRLYFLKVLPNYASTKFGPANWGHSFPQFVAGGEYPVLTSAVAVGLIGVWGWAGARALANGYAPVVFAGALALSTFVQALSFDYNLVTTYPLLLILFVRSRHSDSWGLLVFGVLSLLSSKAVLFGDLEKLRWSMFAQLAFLVIAAISVGESNFDEAQQALAPRA